MLAQRLSVTTWLQLCNQANAIKDEAQKND